MNVLKSLSVGAVLVSAASLSAVEWSQYRGPNHDGSSPEKILKQWPKDGPRVIWKAPLGDSFGALSVGGARVFAFIQRPFDGEDKEVAVALDANSGKELWAVPLGKPTYDRQGGDGPRSTPTVDSKRVYFLGAYQVLTCLDAETGKKIWEHDIPKEFGGKVLKWNSAASPVLEGNLIFVNGGGAGQALLAFNKTDGKVVWKAEDDEPTHASPVLTTIHGVRQVIFFTQKGLVSVVPQTGKVLWRHPYPYKTSSASSPVVWSNIVYCSAPYGIGAGACRVEKDGKGFKAVELWRQPGGLINPWTTPVCKDGYIFGLYSPNRPDAPLKCIEIATGKEVWSQPGFGAGGATVLVDNCILVQSDRGPLILVEATPKGYQEIARAQIYAGKCWTMSVISNGKIYCRNTKEGFCLDVSPKQASR